MPSPIWHNTATRLASFLSPYLLNSFKVISSGFDYWMLTYLSKKNSLCLLLVCVADTWWNGAREGVCSPRCPCRPPSFLHHFPFMHLPACCGFTICFANNLLLGVNGVIHKIWVGMITNCILNCKLCYVEHRQFCVESHEKDMEHSFAVQR